jgi:hypothetical protein
VLDGGAAKARTARKLVLSVDKAFRRARVTCNAIGPYTQPERQSLSQIVSTVKDDTILANDSQRQPSSETKTGLKSTISGPFWNFRQP